MNRSLEERNKLVVDNMNVVYYVINREFSSFSNDEDMIQEGYLGLINAADRWDESSGCPFVVYAIICIRCWITKEIIKLTTQKRSSMLEVSIHEKAPGVEDETIEDTIPGSSGINYFNIEEFFSTLSQNEIYILNMLIDGYSKQEIARAKNVSHQAVSDTVRRITKAWNLFYKENHIRKRKCRKEQISTNGKGN